MNGLFFLYILVNRFIQYIQPPVIPNPMISLVHYEQFIYICICAYFPDNLIVNIKLYNVFHYRSMREYVLSCYVSWLFTSPYLLYNCSKWTNCSLRENVVLEIMQHVVHLVYQANLIEHHWICLVYLIYFVNMFTLYRKHCIFNHIIFCGWFLYVLNESMLYVNIISDETHVSFMIINEIFIKGSFFSMYNFFEKMKQKGINLYELQILYKIYDLFQDTQSQSLLFIKECIRDVITDSSVVHRSKIAMSEQVYSKYFSTEFVNTILRTNNVFVDNVSLLFTDIVKYSTMCCENSSSHMLTLLNNLYNKYDCKIEKIKSLQKIECVGDCYFVSSMLEKKYEDLSGNDIIMLAYHIIECAKSYDVSVRVGVHTGDVSVGIIGTELPRFAVVGNDVNIASRLESTCPLNCIHISDVMYKKLNEPSNAKKQEVHLKNIGVMTTYVIYPQPIP